MLYGLLMRASYGADYTARLALVAEHVGEPGEILEVCPGDLALYRHLAARGLVSRYVGLEQAPAMLRRAQRRGVDVRAFDVRAGGALSAADTVIMQGSLYQFHDVAETLLPRLWAAARRRLVLAEPVKNLTQSRLGPARWLAGALTRTTDGRAHTVRYTEAALLGLYARCGVPVSRLDRTRGGREVVISSLRVDLTAPSP